MSKHVLASRKFLYDAEMFVMCVELLSGNYNPSCNNSILQHERMLCLNSGDLAFVRGTFDAQNSSA